jgi:hypothetical protein
MKRILYTALLAFAVAGSFISCDKVDAASVNLYGHYTGIFNRTGMDTAQVSINFRGDKFYGESNKSQYPAICSGDFDLENSTINFDNSCNWKADFDWSLITSGKYNISMSDGCVRIWKTNGVVTDEFLLRQPSR